MLAGFPQGQWRRLREPLRQELTLWEDPVYPQETVEGNPGSNGMENSGCLGRERRDHHDWVLRGGSMGE